MSDYLDMNARIKKEGFIIDDKRKWIIPVGL